MAGATQILGQFSESGEFIGEHGVVVFIVVVLIVGFGLTLRTFHAFYRAVYDMQNASISVLHTRVAEKDQRIEELHAELRRRKQ